MEKEALINILTQIIIVTGGFVALSVAKTPESLAVAYAFGAGAGLLIAGYFLRDNIRQLFSGFDKKVLCLGIISFFDIQKTHCTVHPVIIRMLF